MCVINKLVQSKSSQSVQCCGKVPCKVQEKRTPPTDQLTKVIGCDVVMRLIAHENHIFLSTLLKL